jgi:serine/threonine protein kinase/WD40 repeat protein
MKCPSCQADNTDTARFCCNCATQLTLAGQPPAALTKTLESPAYVLTKGSLIAGKYRVLEEIGRGGMGVVYKAEDTKLARKVAVKVLPEVFTADPERLARFEREARVLASLNHPNIAAIYGVEEADGKRFLVLELVEGETLAERLSRGALPLEETLQICRQIAEGLEGAHERGIVHRDLKPSNVKITPEGKAKILDFGLAKALVEELTAADIANSPTITANMTQPGVILGTAAYMSPEQATGRPVDKRADIWAFGCILYECLTGKRAFPGDTVTESMAAVLRGEPDWNALPAGTPANVRAVLRRCLQKNPKERLRDIGDARIEVGESATYPSEAVPTLHRFSLPWLAAGAAVILLAGILIDRLLIRHPQSTPAAPAVTSTIKVEPGHWLDGWNSEMQRPSRSAVAIAGDGKFVVYSAVEEHPGPQAKPQLYLRRMDETKAQPIAGTEGGVNPFLSPDNRWVGFWADGKLKKAPVEGGVPHTLCDVALLFGANWGRDNTVVFSDGVYSGLSRVSVEGGKPEILTKPDPKREETSHRLPSWLPTGKAVLFTAMRHGWDPQPGLALLRLDTREWHVLLQDAADARYVPTGHLVFLRQGTLMAVRFDLARLEVIGQPVALVENVMQSFHGGSWFNTCDGQFGISDTGSLIYAAGGLIPDLKNSLVWVDQRGIEEPVTALRLPFYAPRLSPDGQKIAYLNAGRESQVWVYDLNRGTNSPLTGDGIAACPIWTPDSKRLLFGWQKSMVSNLFWQPYDGSSPMERLTTSEYGQEIGSWSSDGKTVALVETHPDTGFDIAMLDVRSGRVTPFLNSPFMEVYPDFSPDGRYIAYTSNESKRNEVYVRAFPGPGLKQQVSSEGGEHALWARNGKQIFYRWYDQYWVVDVRTDSGFATTKPRLLFNKPGISDGLPSRTYDLSLDGQRFLMVKDEQRKPTPVTEMILVQNWFEELKRLVPANKK